MDFVPEASELAVAAPIANAIMATNRSAFRLQPLAQGLMAGAHKINQMRG